jgi:AraC family transcriptional activator of mtrCDE
MSQERLLDRLVSDLNVHVAPFAICAVSAGWCLDLPGPSEVMLHFVLHGQGALRSPNAPVSTLQTCFLAVVPPGTVHELELVGATDHGRVIEEPVHPGQLTRIVAGSFESAELLVACGLVRVQFGDSLGLFDHLREVLVVDLSDVPQVQAAFQGILDEQAQPGLGSATVTAALMSQGLVWMLRKLGTDDGCPLPWLAALEDERLARVVDRIIEEPEASHTVESLADVAGMSRSAFAAHFAEAFNRPPMNLVHHIRMQRAAQLLRQSGISVDEVADRVGFSSRSHFSRSFKRHTGLSPSEYSQGRQASGNLA